MASFLYILNLAFLLVTLIQRATILFHNLYCWYKYGDFADIPSRA